VTQNRQWHGRKLFYGPAGGWRPAVRLYLSSFRLGDHPEHLVRLVSDDGRRKVVIANASMMRRQRCAAL
jgi:hypothetical protein